LEHLVLAGDGRRQYLVGVTLLPRRAHLLKLVQHVLLSQGLNLALSLQLLVGGAVDGLRVPVHAHRHLFLLSTTAGCLGCRWLLHHLVDSCLFPLAESV